MDVYEYLLPRCVSFISWMSFWKWVCYEWSGTVLTDMLQVRGEKPALATYADIRSRWTIQFYIYG